MAQIFVAHSQRDENLRNFFLKCFAVTNVKGVFEEFEKILTSRIITSKKIKEDIENSNAVFVILSESVQNIPHTRDWIVWEAGASKNKDIWIFEHYQQLCRISVIIPYFRHYIIFDTNDIFFNYIRKIIESYDDSHKLLMVLSILTGAAIGAAAAKKNKLEGAIVGGAVGTLGAIAIMSNKPKERPMGEWVICECGSSYNIHIPLGISKFRCPACNRCWELNM